jgi:hypothetical protein
MNIVHPADRISDPVQKRKEREPPWKQRRQGRQPEQSSTESGQVRPLRSTDCLS